MVLLDFSEVLSIWECAIDSYVQGDLLPVLEKEHGKFWSEKATQSRTKAWWERAGDDLLPPAPVK